MTLEDLKVYVAVCHAGSLSGAARKLQCTQPAVSQHIGRLERELGAKLFERSAHGVQSTAAGAVLMEAAAESLSALAAGVERVRELEGYTASNVVLTTGGTTVRHFLRDTVVKFRRADPQVRIRFVPANTTSRCLELIRAGEADLGLVTVHGSRQGVEQQVLALQDLRLLVSRDSPLATRKRLALRELDGLDYIGLSDDTTSAGHLGRQLELENIELRQAMTVDDFDTACVFVELGLGYTIVPAVQAANFCRSSRVAAVPVTDLPAISIGLAARRLDGLSSAAKRFVALFRQELRRFARLPGVTLLEGD